MAKKTRLGLTLALILAIASTTIATLATSASQNKFEVYVPDKLELRIAEDGTSNLVGKQNIFNASTDAIKVKEFKVTGLNGWTVVDYSNDFASYPDNSKYVGVQINGVSLTSATNLSSDWEIASGEWLNLGIDIKVPSFTGEVSLEDCLDIKYKFEWATSSGGPGDGNTDGSGGNTDGSDNGDDLDPSIEYKDFIITKENKHKIVDVSQSDLVIPKTFRDIDGTWYKVTAIDDNAFRYCNKLEHVTIPDGVTSIGKYAFNSCESLKFIDMPNSLITIGENAFSDCDVLALVNIPDSVTSIGGYAFYQCYSLKSVIIPDSVTSIGTMAFCSTALTSITIPASITTMGKVPFAYCSKLESVTISDGSVNIPEHLFSGCTALTSVIIPDSVTTIGRSAFYDCKSLESVIIPDGVTTIGQNAFYNVPHIEYHGTASGQPWGAISIN